MMKKINIFKGVASVALALSMVSCSDDYLDLTPIGEINAEDVPLEVSTLRSATYGVMENMYRQYATLYDYMWFNGEPWFAMVYGEVLGQDLNSYFWANRTGYSMNNWRHMQNNNTWGDMIAWTYCYGIVEQSNYIIAGEANAEANDELKGETAFRIAQAYTMRAHAYIRLQQMFGPRWDDSKNGAVHSVVIRTEVPDPSKPTGKPVSSTNEVMKLIYDDLDRAIELYTLSEYGRAYIWETDINVAYGLYARAALLKNDWVNAENYAHLASQGYDVMTADEYKAGFNSPTSEWMWGSEEGPTGIYYASFGATWACNGAYPCIWGSYGAGAIDYTFYKQMQNPDDIRCQLFYTPDKEGRALRGAFWNPNDCASASMNLNRGERFPSRLQEFCEARYAETGAGARWKFPYSGGYLEDEIYTSIDETYIPFGAQFKFWGKDSYSSSQFPFMRASEMLLIEAEAACHNGHYSVAQDNLEKINSKRIDGYTKTTKTGDDLLAEVKLNRRWELWGEGFNWFDFKRWNEPIVRDAWKQDDINSGNWPGAYAGEFPVNFMNNWRWLIPRVEIDYNDDISDDINNPDYD